MENENVFERFTEIAAVTQYGDIFIIAYLNNERYNNSSSSIIKLLFIGVTTQRLCPAITTRIATIHNDKRIRDC